MCAPEAIDDLKDNHGCPVSIRYIQDIAEAVATISQVKEEKWEYETPKINMPIKTVAISLDGAYFLMHEDGYREAMVGSISLYDSNGERQHSIYIGSAPQYGKATFKKRMEKEINHIKKIYPSAQFIGIADGAKNNWDFLNAHTSKQLLDFYHVTEYLAKAAEAVYSGNRKKLKRQSWLKESCHNLKHHADSALSILSELKQYVKKS